MESRKPMPEEKSDLLRLIDAELDHIKTDLQRPGWSTWALLAALGTVLWVFSNEAISHRLDVYKLVFLFVVISFIIDSGFVLARFLQVLLSHKKTESRFTYSQELGSSIGTGFAIVSHCLFIMLLTWFIKIKLVKWYIFVNYIFYGYIGISFFIFYVVFSRFKIPLARTSGFDWKSDIIVCSFVTFNILGSVSVFGSYILEFTLLEYRATGLLIVASYIIFSLLSTKGKPSLENSLLRVRRDLAMNRISFEEAVQRLDIALVGLKVREVLQDDLEGILAAYDEADSICRRFSEDLDLLLVEMQNQKDKERISPDETRRSIQITDALKQSMNARLQSLTWVGKEIEKRRRQLNFKLGLIRGARSVSKEVLEDLMKKLNEAKERQTAKLNAIKDRTARLDRESPSLLPFHIS